MKIASLALEPAAYILRHFLRDCEYFLRFPLLPIHQLAQRIRDTGVRLKVKESRWTLMKGSEKGTKAKNTIRVNPRQDISKPGVNSSLEDVQQGKIRYS